MNLAFVTFLFAQATEAAGIAERATDVLVKQGGVLGSLIVLLLLRDLYLERRRDSREVARELSRDKELNRLVDAVSSHDQKRDDKTDKLVSKMDHLMKAHMFEALSRPTLGEAARREGESLLRDLSAS